MNETPPVQSSHRSVLLLGLVGVAVVLTVILGLIFLLMVKSPKPGVNAPDVASHVTTDQTISNLQDFSFTNVISIRLGDDESGSGLTLVEPRDGQTAIESIDGVSARAVHLEPGRTEQYFYFQIDPTFKQEDVRRVRFDVEFLDPQPGSLIVHYDALASPNSKPAAYRDATPTLRLTGSNRWQRATFYTRNDAVFSNRQNGKADFRICAKAPVLYVRRVTVTREPVVEIPMAGMKFTAVDAESGEPVANLKVRVSGEETNGSFRSPDAVTDAEGQCLAAHPSNTVSLTLNVSGDGVTPTRIRWQTSAGDTIPTQYVFRVSRPITIGGTVLDESAQPLANAKVSFRDYAFADTPANPRERFLIHGSSVTTKSDGSWEFRSLPPKFRDFSINISHPEFVEARFITSGVGRGFSNMPMDKLTNRTAVVQLRRRGPTLDDSGKPVMENILPNIVAGTDGIKSALPWWKELSAGRRDGMHDPSTPPGRPGSYGIAWGVTGYDMTVLVFQTKQTLTFQTGGWYVQVSVPENSQFSAEDVGKIQADWLEKTYGRAGSMKVQVLQ